MTEVESCAPYYCSSSNSSHCNTTTNKRQKGPFASVATETALAELKRLEQQKDGSTSTIPRFHWDQIDIQSVLGEGAFSVVLKVSVQQPQPEMNNKVGTTTPTATLTDEEKKKKKKEEPSSSQTTMQSTASTATTFALKCLKAKSIPSSKSFVLAATDLAMEANILSQLNHDHIITLRGVSIDTPSDSYTGEGMGQFLIMNALQETLLHRLDQWRFHHEQEHQHYRPQQQQQRRHTWKTMMTSSSTTKSDMIHRVHVVVESILSAMTYLHEKHIVLRDLKPENCGYDPITQQWKLFDFGLARPIQSCSPGDIAGSISYMAPEIMLGAGSCLASDVYSFGILLWELCTLQIPYGDDYYQSLSRDALADQIAIQQIRPSMSFRNLPSRTLRRFITDCWSSSPIHRPTFSILSHRWSAFVIGRTGSGGDGDGGGNNGEHHHSKDEGGETPPKPLSSLPTVPTKMPTTGTTSSTTDATAGCSTPQLRTDVKLKRSSWKNLVVSHVSSSSATMKPSVMTSTPTPTTVSLSSSSSSFSSSS